MCYALYVHLLSSLCQQLLMVSWPTATAQLQLLLPDDSDDSQQTKNQKRLI